VILDTGALSAFVEGDRQLISLLRAHEHLAIPVIVLGEYRFGIAFSSKRDAYETWLQSYLTRFDVLTINAETADVYAALRVALKTAGTPIPANDAWIAALALQHRLPLASRDAHFDHVRGLRRAAW
jgi:predicted nucleic acid-binding protein